MWEFVKLLFHDSSQFSTLPHWCFSIKHKKVFFQTHRKLPKTNFRDCALLMSTKHRLQNWLFAILWVRKKPFLCLMLRNQWCSVESCLESQIGHFTSSHSPRFRTKRLLFYLMKWQYSIFKWLHLNSFFSVGAVCKSCYKHIRVLSWLAKC